MSTTPISIPLSALQSGQIPHTTLLDAFGPSSLGILLVTDLPPSFPALRRTVLANSSRLAALPTPTLDSLTNARAKYLVGWSHGKETLRPGVVDTLKGSYYINCAFYQDPSLNGADGEKWAGFEEYTADNIWPPETTTTTEDGGEIPGFRSAAEQLITLIIDTAVLVARACDTYAQAEIEGYEAGYLEKVVRTSTTTKARLLHYFPSEPSPQSQSSSDKADGDMDDWCATHLDHGCLTGLTSAMFVDESPSPSSSSPNTNTITELDRSPDPTAGLYIRSRTSTITKVSIPRDALAFQTGEALELITRGRFRAVPHFVRGVDVKKVEGRRIARNTLAVFTQPNLDELVDVERGWTFGEFARGVVGRNTMKDEGEGEGQRQGT